MSKKDPPLFTVLSYLPWWASVLSGLVVYLCLSYVFPALASDNPFLSMLTQAGKNIAPIFWGLFLIPAIASIFMRNKRAKLLAQQKSIDTLKALSWQEFEILVGEAFRRKGYSVAENMAEGADGGIDLLLKKEGETHIVQCKQWRKSKIGVAVVREMFGVLKASSAKSVFVVCSGDYTKEAVAFAANLPVQLVDGNELLSIIKDVHVGDAQSYTIPEPVTPSSAANKCPKCHSDLVSRVAKRGPNAGNKFFGCSSFPKCRYTLS